MDYDAAGTGGAGGHPIETSAGRRVPGVPPDAAERPDRGAGGEGVGRPHSGDWRQERAGGPAGDRPPDGGGAAGGLKLPFHISITAGGRNYAEVTVKSFQANTGLQVKDLEKQP